MNDAIGTYTIGLDTPIHMLTPRQLFGMMEEWQANSPKMEDKTPQTQKWYAKSMGELAENLGVSEATVYRMKSQGLLDDCISQYGRWVLVDMEKVIEKFKLSNRRRKKK